MAATSADKMVGMYVHQHWPYNRPYCARTWTLDDWRGYAEGLHTLGYNTILVWPVLETIPDPPTPSDWAHLQKTGKVIRMLHEDFGMRVWLALCPNVEPIPAEAAASDYERRHFFYCDRRVDPADRDAVAAMLRRRAKVLEPLKEADGVSIIDSDPGGYPGSTNQEFVDLLVEHRRLLDRLRPGIELVYWMHAGWLGYNRFYTTGMLTFSTDEENLDCLDRLIKAAPEPWGLANGLSLAEKIGIADRVVSFNYGRIEGEPSFPLTNFGGNAAWEGGSAPGPRGVMGNAQTHCVQLPNTFAFARGSKKEPVTEADYISFAEDLIPGHGRAIVEGWTCLNLSEPARMRAGAAALDALADKTPESGRLKGLLFGDPCRFLRDLAMMLRMRAGYAEIKSADGAVPKQAVQAFTEGATIWQRQHGYENSWWWPDLDETLRKLACPEVNAVLDSQMNPWVLPPAGIGMSPFEYVADSLKRAESFTPRLLAALRSACR